MSVRFTDEQSRELDRAAGEIVSMIDPRSSTEYALISRTQYEQQLRNSQDEVDLRRFMIGSAQRLFQSIDQEENQHGQAW